MLLFVVYQLWWTNWKAFLESDSAKSSLQKEWQSVEQQSSAGEQAGAAANPGPFSAGERFALIHVPKLDLSAPVAEGVSNDVLDKGMVGHYDKSPVKTAMPWDEEGNFALAGHRNTHGEPFRYINRLVSGDEMVVETESAYYTYKVASRLPSTSPSNTEVIDPVPKESGFEKPGRYITLTTCTPEFTSKYRLIVWGKMVEERPRSDGEPDSLAD